MCLIGILLMRRAVANVAVHYNQRRPIGGLVKYLVRTGQHGEVVGIGDPRDIPPVADKAGHHVFAEGPCRGTVQRHAVIVVNPAQARELEMSRERSSFARYTFHEVSISADHIYFEIEDFKVW